MSVYFYDDVLISKASNGLFSFSFFSSLSCFKVSKDFSGSVLSVAWVWIGLASLFWAFGLLGFWAFGQFLCLFNLFTDYIIPSQICFSFTVFFLYFLFWVVFIIVLGFRKGLLIIRSYKYFLA